LKAESWGEHFEPKLMRVWSRDCFTIRKLINGLYRSYNIVRAINCRRLGWAELVAKMEDGVLSRF
jgi:hypothetical protein